ncbi:MAG: enoyl-CoA hydratase/isomerase family protein [Candidatus Micrarchaeota archaeon]
MPALVFEKREHTAYILLNRPAQKNAINLELRQALREAWKEVDEDRDIFSVIVSGGEEVFSVGQDLLELEQFKKSDPIQDLPLNTLQTFGSEVGKPVIAAISGHCLGYGFLLTMVGCDLRIASTSALFGMPEIKVGVPPSLGIPAYVARHFPPAAAMELLLTGNFISAEAAHRYGYVNRVVPRSEVIGEAERISRTINAYSPFMARNIKKMARFAFTPDSGAIAYSQAICLYCRHSPDYLEGPKAFKEKRAPKWEDR